MPAENINHQREILAHLYHPIFHTVCLYTRDLHMAEDITQETFLKALKNLNQLRDKSQLKAWLQRIAANTARDYMRRNARSFCVSDPDLLYVAAGQDSPENELLRKEKIRAIWQQVEKMPQGMRRVLLLRYFYDLSLEQIGAIMEIPVGTVKSRLNRGRNRLAGELKCKEA